MKKHFQFLSRLKNEQYLISYCLCFLILLIMVSLAIFADGTADEGDSITHYLLAKSSWIHHELFLDHWGKPVFTLLVSPVAQLPFVGIKILNSVLFSISVFFTVVIANKMKMSNLFLIPLLALFTPHYVVNSLSGLTEPMFNLWLVITLWISLNQRFFFATVFVSFLPFVRSEGLIILIVFAAYLLYYKKYKYLPLLFIGHLVFSLAGYFFAEKSLLWVFSEMTYGELKSNYGKGPWTDFFYKAPLVFGIPGLLLIVIGIIAYTLKIFKKESWQKPFFAYKIFLIFGSALGLFFFHVFAWGMGWFHSFGLTRVLNGVMGPFLLIALFGFEFIINIFSELRHKLIIVVTTCLIVIFPLMNKKYGFNFDKQFKLKAMQRVINQAAETIKEFYPDYASRIICYEASYLALALNIDFYDKERRSIMGYSVYKNLPQGSLLVWDEWYAVTQGHAPIDSIQNNDSFKKIAEFKDFEPWDNWDEPHYAIVFEKIK